MTDPAENPGPPKLFKSQNQVILAGVIVVVALFAIASFSTFAIGEWTNTMPVGAKGPTGGTGKRGIDGDVGPTGHTGRAGPTGPTGDAGRNGETGADACDPPIGQYAQAVCASGTYERYGD